MRWHHSSFVTTGAHKGPVIRKDLVVVVVRVMRPSYDF